MTRSLSWYINRVRHMDAGEAGWRLLDHGRKTSWRRRRVRIGQAAPTPVGLLSDRGFATVVPDSARSRIPEEASLALVRRADRSLAGEWKLFGTTVDIRDPDWFGDPSTGCRAPSEQYAFSIDHRDERVTGNVKMIWEVSRHHHLTVLAGAFWLTGDSRYAEVVAAQLRSWWRVNPFLSGIHWTSGIELGIRLISWVWIRRLLASWDGVESLFEENEEAIQQLWWHQLYLSSFRSRGSSANNHVIAEMAGLLIASTAFPWFSESDRWRRMSANQLQRNLKCNTFDDGVNRELATDYHGLVTELAMLAAVEADAGREPLAPGTWRLLSASVDAAAALVDARGRPPRQGDGDEGMALDLDDRDERPWEGVLSLGGDIFGPLAWWPAMESTVWSVLVGSLASGHKEIPGRPHVRPSSFRVAGIHLMRSRSQLQPEIWCRCDCGPHGLPTMAAHGHADALAIEVRYGGEEILVDPGTYCYHGEPAWRSYFRSTLAHNTVEVDGVSQSVESGPFMWGFQAQSQLVTLDYEGDSLVEWTASHNGYQRLAEPVAHTRTVRLIDEDRQLRVVDSLEATGRHRIRIAFHLGPNVSCWLTGHGATLTWQTDRGMGKAVLDLPDSAVWTTHRGETSEILGWYSPGFGVKVPVVSIIGTMDLVDRAELTSCLTFCDVDRMGVHHRAGDTSTPV